MHFFQDRTRMHWANLILNIASIRHEDSCTDSNRPVERKSRTEEPTIAPAWATADVPCLPSRFSFISFKFSWKKKHQSPPLHACLLHSRLDISLPTTQEPTKPQRYYSHAIFFKNKSNFELLLLGLSVNAIHWLIRIWKNILQSSTVSTLSACVDCSRTVKKHLQHTSIYLAQCIVYNTTVLTCAWFGQQNGVSRVPI